MKRLIKIFVTVTVICCIALFGACSMQGKSAYDIAVENGYQGTVTEWLESLKGTDGKSAYEVAVENGFKGTVTEWLKSLKGTNGKNGTDGKDAVEEKTNEAQNISAAINRTMYETVAVEAYDSSYVNASLGTATVYSVDRNDETETATVYLITAYHVIYSDVRSNPAVCNTVKVAAYGYEYYWGDTSDSKITDAEGNEVQTTERATFVGGSVANDFAVLKVENSAYFYKTNVQAATFADSDAVTVGEACYTVGFGSGNGLTATRGVVSSASEYLNSQDSDGRTQVYRYIRSDMSVNGGNSGGALMNANGEYVGMISAKLNTTMGFEGMAYCLPGNLVAGLAQNIIDNNGTFRMAKTNATLAVQGVYTEFDESTGKTNVECSVAFKTIENGALNNVNTKILPGDVLISIAVGRNTKRITQLWQVNEALLAVREGDRVVFTVSRNSERLQIEVTFTQAYFYVPASTFDTV